MNQHAPMKTVLLCVLLCLSGLTLPATARSATDSASRQVAPETDSQQMSTDLQSLPWKPFQAIIKAVPKLAAGVDAYGPLGWQFVRENYTTYNWKKKIDKLDAVQKKQLAELIRKARTAP